MEKLPDPKLEIPDNATDREAVAIIAGLLMPYATATNRLSTEVKDLRDELAKTKLRLRKRHDKLKTVTRNLTKVTNKLLEKQTVQDALNESTAVKMETRREMEEIVLTDLKILHDAMFLVCGVLYNRN